MKTQPPASSAAKVEDLLRTPDDGRKYELVDGEILVSPGGFRHCMVGIEIAHLLKRVLETVPAGVVCGSDVGIVLPHGNVRSPDVSFFRKEKVPPGDPPDAFAEFIPDLVVEILSPSDRMRQVADKIGEFLEAGVRLVWSIQHPRPLPFTGR